MDFSRRLMGDGRQDRKC